MKKKPTFPSKISCSVPLIDVNHKESSPIIYKKSKSKEILGIKSDFGKNSPKFTIGSSRKIQEIIFGTPGPGDYDCSVPKSSRIPYKIPSSRKASFKPSITSSVDFIDYRTFPSKTQAFIPKSPRKGFYDINDCPAPDRYQKIDTMISDKAHFLSPRPENKPQDTKIGPGLYSPNYFFQDRTIRISLRQQPYERKIWDADLSIPGPETYEITASEPSRVTHIGINSVPHRLKRGEQPKIECNTYAISRFFVKVPINESKQFIEDLSFFPDLYEFLDEIANIVLISKPKDPIGYIRDYCLKKFSNGFY